jgi:hypothetical protein
VGSRRLEYRRGLRRFIHRWYVLQPCVLLASIIDGRARGGGFPRVDNLVGCSGSAISHLALLECKCFVAWSMIQYSLSTFILSTASRTGPEAAMGHCSKCLAPAVSCVNSRCRNDCLFNSDTPYLVGYWHSHHYHLRHCHNVPPSIPKPSNEGAVT